MHFWIFRYIQSCKADFVKSYQKVQKVSSTERAKMFVLKIGQYWYIQYIKNQNYIYVDFRSGGILKKHLKKLDPKIVFSREFFFVRKTVFWDYLFYYLLNAFPLM
jgi:hypothetical protein